MKRVSDIISWVALIAIMAVSCTPDRYITITGFAQGGTYSVKMNLKGVETKPEIIRDSIDAILVNIDNSLSGYNAKSLLSRFNSGETIRPDSLFLDIYAHARLIYDQTDGVVDVASAPLFDIWGFGFTGSDIPSEKTISDVMSDSGLDRMEEDMRKIMETDGTIDGMRMLLENQTAALPELNYNAIAQGYSCDVVARYLYSIGVRDMLVDIGEIFCDGVNPSGLPWSLGIDKPIDGNQEAGADIQGIFRAPDGPHGIVTSGNYRKFHVRDGKKYAHTIDPRTGYPVEHNLLSSTIIAKNALMADAYATYCMVIGLEKSKEFLESRPDLEGCLIYDHQGEFRTWCSSGFILESVSEDL